MGRTATLWPGPIASRTATPSAGIAVPGVRFCRAMTTLSSACRRKVGKPEGLGEPLECGAVMGVGGFCMVPRAPRHRPSNIAETYDPFGPITGHQSGAGTHAQVGAPIG